jgi:hypothetical protein
MFFPSSCPFSFGCVVFGGGEIQSGLDLTLAPLRINHYRPGPRLDTAILLLCPLSLRCRARLLNVLRRGVRRAGSWLAIVFINNRQHLDWLTAAAVQLFSVTLQVLTLEHRRQGPPPGVTPSSRPAAAGRPQAAGPVALKLPHKSRSQAPL